MRGERENTEILTSSINAGMLDRLSILIAILQRPRLHQIFLDIQNIEGIVGEARAPRNGLAVRRLVQQAAGKLEICPRCSQGNLADGSKMVDHAFGLDGREGRRRRCGRRGGRYGGAVAVGGAAEARVRDADRRHFHGGKCLWKGKKKKGRERREQASF